MDPRFNCFFFFFFGFGRQNLFFAPLICSRIFGFAFFFFSSEGYASAPPLRRTLHFTSSFVIFLSISPHSLASDNTLTLSFCVLACFFILSLFLFFFFSFLYLITRPSPFPFPFVSYFLNATYAEITTRPGNNRKNKRNALPHSRLHFYPLSYPLHFPHHQLLSLSLPSRQLALATTCTRSLALLSLHLSLYLPSAHQHINSIS